MKIAPLPLAMYADENALDDYEVVREASRPLPVDPDGLYAESHWDLIKPGYQLPTPPGTASDGYGRGNARNLKVANFDRNSAVNQFGKPDPNDLSRNENPLDRFERDENGQYVMSKGQFDQIQRANRKKIENWHYEFENNYF
jgi:hypothetical protein